jgi:hypothetical protein
MIFIKILDFLLKTVLLIFLILRYRPLRPLSKPTYWWSLKPNSVQQMISFIEKFFSQWKVNIVRAKIERSECLYWSIMVDKQSIRRQVVLMCCCAVLELDVVTIHHRSCCTLDWEWWVSILIDNGGYAVDQKTSCLTLLLCSAWARCCAPAAPILFDQRLSVVSVYIER